MRSLILLALLSLIFGCDTAKFKSASGVSQSEDDRNSSDQQGAVDNDNGNNDGGSNPDNDRPGDDEPNPPDDVAPSPSPSPSNDPLPPTTEACGGQAAWGDFQPVQLIRTQQELQAISGQSGNYRLANDINLVGDFTPISLARSVFDGGNFTIRNLRVKDHLWGGLFQTVVYSILRNLTVDGVNINYEYTDLNKNMGWIGGLVGVVDLSTLENLHIKNGTVRGASAVGALIGFALDAGGSCPRQSHTIINNVSAQDVMLEGYHRFNSIVGAIAGGYIDNTEVNNATFSQINFKQYNTQTQAFDPSTVVSKQVGRVDGSPNP